MPPEEIVTRLAAEKAKDVAQRLSAGLIIGADTIVVYRQQVLGKPVDEAEAVEMLRKLQGDIHEVYTGIALADASTGECVTSHERTFVIFRPLDEEEIQYYVATGEPMDKAGAYGAQGIGAAFVEHIEGSYTNVVGLPLSRLTLMLKKFSIEIIKK